MVPNLSLSLSLLLFTGARRSKPGGFQLFSGKVLIVSQTLWKCSFWVSLTGQERRKGRTRKITPPNRGPNPHPKSRNTKKHRVYTNFFEKFSRTCAFFPVTRVRNQRRLFRKTCSDELFYFGWIFPGGFWMRLFCLQLEASCLQWSFFCLWLTILAFWLTIGAFLLTIGAFLLTI